MISSILNAAPNFGKREAIVFTSALALETLVRYSFPEKVNLKDIPKNVTEKQINEMRDRTLALIKNTKIFLLDAIKHIQFYAASATQPSYALSWVAKLKAHACLLPSNIIGVRWLSRIIGMQKFSNAPRTYTHLEIERPPLVSFVACLGETAKIYAKVIGCLGTGRIVQKMWTGSSSGKIATAVSSALFILSTWNIKNAVAYL